MKRGSCVGVAIFGLTLGCTGTVGSGTEPPPFEVGSGGIAGAASGTGGTLAGGVGQGGGAGGSDFAGSDGTGPAGTTSVGGVGGSSGGASSGASYCAVLALVGNRCATCHTNPPPRGVPMAML